nr:zinc finger, CCHC-type [Tanacetum cinerariifolium]
MLLTNSSNLATSLNRIRGSSSNSCGRGRGHGRGNWSGNRGGRGRGGGNQQRDGYRRFDKNHDKSKVQCYNCQQYGHYAAECRNPRRERNHEANLTQENNDGEPALLLSTFDEDDRVQEVFLNEENSATGVGGDTSLWYLDNGASNHMTGYKDKFRELDRSIQGSVKFGDGSKVRIEGKGSILVKCKNGEHHLLQEVYFIPRLCSNIISLGQLAKGGDQIIMHGSFLWVHDVKGKLLMKVRRSPNRLYKIQLKKVKSRCLLGKSDAEVKLWHTRMGHVNYAALKLMSDKEMVQGIPKITNQNGLCEGCLEGKQARKSFPTYSNFMSTKRLELVHGDLCGPISPPIPTGNREMKPNRNGDGKKYYERDAVYVLNRVTTKSLHNSTPYQMWTGRKPSIGHIRVFGCVAYVKVVSGHIQKLDNMSKLLVHLEVETGTKAYRLFDLDTGRIWVTRDVLFDEERPWQWGKSEKFKGTLGATLTLEGFIPQDDREDNDMESQMGLEFPAQGTDEHYKTNLEDEPVTLISSVGSAGSTSSSTRGGAPKRYRTLTDLYDETNEVLLLNDGEEPTSYFMAYKHEEWKEAMKTELDSIERNNTWTLVELPRKQ